MNARQLIDEALGSYRIILDNSQEVVDFFRPLSKTSSIYGWQMGTARAEGTVPCNIILKHGREEGGQLFTAFWVFLTDEQLKQVMRFKVNASLDDGHDQLGEAQAGDDGFTLINVEFNDAYEFWRALKGYTKRDLHDEHNEPLTSFLDRRRPDERFFIVADLPQRLSAMVIMNADQLRDFQRNRVSMTLEA